MVAQLLEASVESKTEELSEEIKVLKDQISNLESENESLRSQAATAVALQSQAATATAVALQSQAATATAVATAAAEQKVHPEKTATYLVEEVAIVEPIQQTVIADNMTAQIKSLDTGNQTVEEFHARKEPRAPVSFLTKQRSLTDRQQESHDTLLKCLTEDKRFEKNRPAVACIVYKSLLHWRSFEAEKTHIFDKIIQTIRTSIEAPRSIRTRSIRGSSRNIHSNIVAKQQALHMHWKSIVSKLDHALTILSDNYVPFIITRKIFSQVFSYMNIQLFNSLLLRCECCSFTNGEYLKAGLHELELWCLKATDQFAGSSWDELKHIRQVVGFLVLSIPQIYRIGTMFWDDKYGAQGLSQEVSPRMFVLIFSNLSTSFKYDENLQNYNLV
ncbi:hypothetical protein RIF29_38507 [Crotalaria pallida]|uniref:Dilute domain-containing protein n=1 Tax=Crotalaria pallida TaxID=3830 RepID=A0AAN9E5M9_CROPI